MENEKFKRALAAALIPEYENSIPLTEEHEFSPGFEKKMQKLIHRQRKPYFKLINTSLKRAACFAACVTIASSAAVMSSDALRSTIADLYIDIFHDHSVVTPAEQDADAPTTIEDIYAITYDLSDYKITFESHYELSRNIYYEKGEDSIDFVQHVKSEYNVTWNTEGAEIETVMLNDYEAVYFSNLGYYTLIWEGEDYIFSIDTTLGKNILIDMANSVQKVE